MRTRPRGFSASNLACVLACGGACWLASAPSRAQEVNFGRDIRPILSDRCYKCHGPDSETRAAGLRLDTPEGARASLRDGSRAISPGDLKSSVLWRRINAADPGDRMPPPDSGKSLSPEEIERLRRWIEQGAAYSAHWSFAPPERPGLPAISKADWPRNEIDRFILARLERDHLAPQPEADRRTLIRRLSLDLTGLPPTPEEVADFLADESPGAYERLVERLLASPRHGERMALEWLDAARYGDTNGYHIDNERTMWRWRDWVIAAYNANMPFDQFTIEQLAGDLLPEATLEQKIASGFHRNHIINFEGGAIPEEYHNAYVVDRVNTTGTVWLGLTVACAQCHDHKFDPITTEDYYRFYAFFNSVPEEGLDGRIGNSVPFIPAPLPDQRARYEELSAAQQRLRAELAAPLPELDAAQREWEQAVGERLAHDWRILSPFSATTDHGATLTRQEDESLLAEGPVPDKDAYEIIAFTHERDLVALRLEAMGDPRIAGGGPGRYEHANFVLSEIELEIAPLDQPQRREPVRFVTAHADLSQPAFHVSRAIDADPATGWAVGPVATPGRSRAAVFVAEKPFGFANGTALRIRLRHESQYAKHSLGRVRLAVSGAPDVRDALRPTERGPWRVAGPFSAPPEGSAFDYAFPPERPGDEAGEIAWVAQEDWTDGKLQTLSSAPNAATYLYRELDAPQAREAVASLGSDDSIKLWLNGELLHANAAARPLAAEQDRVLLPLKPGKNTLLIKVVNVAGGAGFYFDLREDHSLDPPLEIATALAIPQEARGERERDLLRERYRGLHWDGWKPLKDEETRVSRELVELSKDIPTTMVMDSMPTPRKTFILRRGQYDAPVAEVTPGTPKSLPPLPEGAAADRLALARWLVSPENPLTARVTVNRLWQMLFGAGLVETVEDFGAQGAAPSHPQLLDWLATEFIASGWDTRHMLRLMVTSASYRQSARATPELLETDPQNRLLARSPRLRLSAEALRDNALAISGLLMERLGGPSVKIYQPPGLWEEVSLDPLGREFTAQVFEASSGSDLYRRSLYVFRKRSVPPPTLALFDAPSREVCTVRRSRTNTPLQALALMNDPVYVEAARVFAERIVKSGGNSPEARVRRAFELALAREPLASELSILINAYQAQRERFARDAEAAAALLMVGERQRDESLDPREVAAWTCVASMLLNLDETVTRG